jgi:hypothetical protein
MCVSRKWRCPLPPNPLSVFSPKMKCTLALLAAAFAVAQSQTIVDIVKGDPGEAAHCSRVRAHALSLSQKNNTSPSAPTPAHPPHALPTPSTPPSQS